MTFQFNSFADFLAMAGHGGFVWICYLVTALGIGYLAVSARVKRRTFFKIQRAIFARGR